MLRRLAPGPRHRQNKRNKVLNAKFNFKPVIYTIMKPEVNNILAKLQADNKTELKSQEVNLGIREAIAELEQEIDFIRQEESTLMKEAQKAKSQIIKIANSLINSADTAFAAAEGSAAFVQKELKGLGVDDIIANTNKAFNSFETEYMTIQRAIQDVESAAKQL